MTFAAAASVLVALLLLALKLTAWWFSDSVAMFGSLMDSALDLMASGVTLIAVRSALAPPDVEHSFGHGKAEALAALFQGAVMSGAAVFLVLQSMSRLMMDRPAEATGLVVAVSAAAIVLTAALVLFQTYVIRHSGSLAIMGDQLHYRGDLAMNIGVIAAALLMQAGWQAGDAVVGILIAAYILRSAYTVVRPAIDMLMDHELSDEERLSIAQQAIQVSGVEGIHDLRTRRAGLQQFIQVHVEVDGSLSVVAGHKVALDVQQAIQTLYPEADILVHVDPLGGNYMPKQSAAPSSPHGLVKVL